MQPSFVYIFRRLFLLGIIIFSAFFSIGQTFVIGSLADETIRSLQLSGNFDSSVSFTVRPVNIQSPSGTIPFFGQTYKLPGVTFARKGVLRLLPLSVTQQFNSHHPYGWNDGSMIAAKGYQSQISAGIYAKYGPLEIQLQPEFVYASNPLYETGPGYGTTTLRSYSKLLPGQSSVRLSVGGFSAGVSTQNLWWGPGIHSSLLMSNNATGFLHGFFSSAKPVKTPIGSFEWQLIGARLVSDNSRPYESNALQMASPLPRARYLSAYVISYQPKWVPGLFLGMTRALQRYTSDIGLSGSSIFSRYIPVLVKPVQKINALGDDTLGTDQLASFFFRWVLPKAHFEFYGEYGFNDYGVNFRDYLMAPTHAAAYLAGIKKIITLQQDARLEFGAEVTQMSQSPDFLVRDAGNWYEHSTVRQGYTNDNQIMGAGAGFGCNVQSLTGTYIKGWKQLGVLLERVEHDPVNRTYNWIDLSIGILPQWKYQNMVLSGLIQFINSDHYIWQNDAERFNLHMKINIQYLF